MSNPDISNTERALLSVALHICAALWIVAAVCAAWSAVLTDSYPFGIR